VSTSKNRLYKNSDLHHFSQVTSTLQRHLKESGNVIFASVSALVIATAEIRFCCIETMLETSALRESVLNLGSIDKKSRAKNLVAASFEIVML
jgi:hypothetical protein